MAKNKKSQEDSVSEPKEDPTPPAAPVAKPVAKAAAPAAPKLPDPVMTFDRYFGITGRPVRHKAGLRAFLKGADKAKKPLSQWKKIFAAY